MPGSYPRSKRFLPANDPEAQRQSEIPMDWTGVSLGSDAMYRMIVRIW